MSRLQVHQFPCLQDNYGFLLHDPGSGATACIDTPESGAINTALAEQGWELTHILNTHHHPDHVGGNLALKKRWGCVIWGPAGEARRIPGLDRALDDGEQFDFGGEPVEVLETPGHTLGHIVYYLPQAQIAFVGDTLFALGCGRLFEGSPEQMWASLGRLRAWPDAVQLYCAHEYTEANLAFSESLMPEDPALRERGKTVRARRAEGLPTVPTDMGLERRSNLFLRAEEPAVQAAVDQAGASPVTVFAEIRRRKDCF